jgi:oligopeptide/dipeptide ABC transporter ATP-binding protein
MYAGRIVELAETESLFKDPKHPYTKLLLSAVPSVDPDQKLNLSTGGEVADAGRLPPGCSFNPRCPCKLDCCDKVVPELKLQPDGRFVACHLD